MDARNPDRSRPRLLAEAGLMLAVVWLLFGLLLGLFRLHGRSQVRLILAHAAFNVALTLQA